MLRFGRCSHRLNFSPFSMRKLSPVLLLALLGLATVSHSRPLLVSECRRPAADIATIIAFQQNRTVDACKALCCSTSQLNAQSAISRHSFVVLALRSQEVGQAASNGDGQLTGAARNAGGDDAWWTDDGTDGAAVAGTARTAADSQGTDAAVLGIQAQLDALDDEGQDETAVDVRRAWCRACVGALAHWAAVCWRELPASTCCLACGRYIWLQGTWPF